MTFEKGRFAIIRSPLYLDGRVVRRQPDDELLRDPRRLIAEVEQRV